MDSDSNDDNFDDSKDGGMSNDKHDAPKDGLLEDEARLHVRHANGRGPLSAVTLEALLFRHDEADTSVFWRPGRVEKPLNPYAIIDELSIAVNRKLLASIIGYRQVLPGIIGQNRLIRPKLAQIIAIPIFPKSDKKMTL